jgi:diaminopimelate epimerase
MSLSAVVRFEKWEGLGNDFILLRDAAFSIDDAAVLRLCDRRFGVGADGVLLVDTVGRARPRMIVRNADGSRPEMCGNGLRCVVGSLGLVGTVVVDTDAGAKTCDARATGEGLVDVRVDMGANTLTFATIDMGNPHAVTFDAFGAELLADVGPLLNRRVAGGVNVELCERTADEIEVLVWERGVGPTLACGTGACAVAAAACDAGLARFGLPEKVRLPGGVLEITVDRTSREVRMRGPARRVFQGEVRLA